MQGRPIISDPGDEQPGEHIHNMSFKAEVEELLKGMAERMGERFDREAYAKLLGKNKSLGKSGAIIGTAGSREGNIAISPYLIELQQVLARQSSPSTSAEDLVDKLLEEQHILKESTKFTQHIRIKPHLNKPFVGNGKSRKSKGKKRRK